MPHLARATLIVLLSMMLSVTPAALGAAETNATRTSWDCMYEWFRSIGFKPSPANEYLQLFAQEEVSESILKMSTSDELKDIGITKHGHRALIHSSLQTVLMCENSGSCDLITDNETPSFQCSCLDGFSGERCQYVTGCGETVCKNKGSCTLNEGLVQCTCAPGYYGDYCEHDVCDEQPCLNGGTCSHSVGGYTCVCPLGYNGTYCESAWLNKNSFDRLTKQVAFLEDLHVWSYNRNDELLSEVQESIKSTQGPRFFIKKSTIGGVIQTRHFMVDRADYLAVLIDNPTEPQLSSVAVYKYLSNGSITLLQSIPSIGPTALTSFNINSDIYIAVISTPSSGSNGPNTRSILYKWQSEGEQFSFVREFNAPGARDVEFVLVHGTISFLVFSCGTNGYGRVQNTKAFVWDPTTKEFVFYQYLVTHGGERIHSVVTPDNQYFLTVSSLTRSTVFRWNGTYFDFHQQFLPSKDLYPFQIGWHTFLAAVNDGSNEQAMSKLYRLDDHLRQFVLHSSFPIHGTLTAEYIHINSEHFIAFGRSSLQDTVSVYKLDGTQTVPFQTLAEAGSVHSISAFTLHNGCVVLTVSQGQDLNQPTTHLYTWRNALNKTPCPTT